MVIPVPYGLSSAEAPVRLSGIGPTCSPEAASPVVAAGDAQLRDPLMVVLLVAAALTIVTGDWTDTAVILLVVVVNTSRGGPGNTRRPGHHGLVTAHRRRWPG